MKKTHFTLIVLLATIITVQGQQKTEFGGGLGAFNYTGDLTRKYRILSHRPAGNLHYKFNLSNAVSFRAGLTAGWIYGSDDKPYDAFATQRARTFRVFAFETTAIMEYNFLDFKGNHPLIFGTPYLFGGFGITSITGAGPVDGTFSPVQPVLPLGAGFKYTLNPHWYLGFEFGARVLFFDYIDGVSYGDTRYKDYQYGNWLDNDMYYYAGFSITYSFYKILCPTNPY